MIGKKKNEVKQANWQNDLFKVVGLPPRLIKTPVPLYFRPALHFWAYIARLTSTRLENR